MKIHHCLKINQRHGTSARNINITQIINELESLLNSTVPAKGKPFPKIRGPSKQDKVINPTQNVNRETDMSK